MKKYLKYIVLGIITILVLVALFNVSFDFGYLSDEKIMSSPSVQKKKIIPIEEVPIVQCSDRYMEHITIKF